MLMKIISCVLLVFLSAAILSSARLMPPGAEVNGSSAIKASIAISTTNKTMVKTLAGIEESLKKLSIKQVMRKVGNANKSASRVQGNKGVRSSHLNDEVDNGFMAFTADYHRPKHHPPKNN
ncbi:hypothetical protein TanjilG_28524 [Lupinus angustifolius]|uniref:Uncharacterized protein n=1 Tax=Lupinus angustifolius TaxID=3871 RepID=A0A394DCZ8_LUPAN|nr:PREDICTED: root meristem growth factor 2-like [Lupinus angustifolius]OIW21075.1 hypothetical protein TanjilG_28524 [Lupinus angustifolius]